MHAQSNTFCQTLRIYAWVFWLQVVTTTNYCICKFTNKLLTLFVCWCRLCSTELRSAIPIHGENCENHSLPSTHRPPSLLHRRFGAIIIIICAWVSAVTNPLRFIYVCNRTHVQLTRLNMRLFRQRGDANVFAERNFYECMFVSCNLCIQFLSHVHCALVHRFVWVRVAMNLWAETWCNTHMGMQAGSCGGTFFLFLLSSFFFSISSDPIEWMWTIPMHDYSFNLLQINTKSIIIIYRVVSLYHFFCFPLLPHGPRTLWREIKTKKKKKKKSENRNCLRSVNGSWTT